MAHDDYYHRLLKSADERLMRASNAPHEAETCAERYEQMARVVGARVASVVEAFVDARMAHHELAENK